MLFEYDIELALKLEIRGGKKSIEKFIENFSIDLPHKEDECELQPNINITNEYALEAFSRLEYYADYQKSVFLEDIADFFMEKFKISINEISTFLVKQSLSSEICIMVKIANCRTPSLFFTRQFINFIVSLNANVKIDFYKNKIFSLPINKISEYEPLYSPEVLNGTKFMINLSLYSDSFDPVDLTRRLNIKPTHYYYKGDPIPLHPGLYSVPNSPAKIRKESCWEYSLEQTDNSDLNILLQKIITELDQDINIIRNYIEEYAVCSKFILLIEHPLNKSFGLRLDRNFFKVAFELDAEIDCDIYV